MSPTPAHMPRRNCLAGELWNVVGDSILCKIPGSATAQSFSVIEVLTPPGGGAPLHMHRREDEVFQVVEGEYEIVVGEKVMRLRPGEVAAGVRGTPHRYRNVGTRAARMLVTIIPAGFECFFQEVHEQGHVDPQTLVRLADPYELTFLS